MPQLKKQIIFVFKKPNYKLALKSGIVKKRSQLKYRTRFSLFVNLSNKKIDRS